MDDRLVNAKEMTMKTSVAEARMAANLASETARLWDERNLRNLVSFFRVLVNGVDHSKWFWRNPRNKAPSRFSRLRKVVEVLP